MHTSPVVTCTMHYYIWFDCVRAFYSWVIVNIYINTISVTKWPLVKDSLQFWLILLLKILYNKQSMHLLQICSIRSTVWQRARSAHDAVAAISPYTSNCLPHFKFPIQQCPYLDSKQSIQAAEPRFSEETMTKERAYQ